MARDLRRSISDPHLVSSGKASGVGQRPQNVAHPSPSDKQSPPREWPDWRRCVHRSTSECTTVNEMPDCVIHYAEERADSAVKLVPDELDPVGAGLAAPLATCRNTMHNGGNDASDNPALLNNVKRLPGFLSVT
jgi:hypothetical protein